MKQLSIILLFAIVVFFATAAQAMDVRLQWDANTTDYGLAGYKIYSATTESGDYDIPTILTLAQNENTNPAVFEYTVANLPNTRTRFVVTAYDTQGQESGYSNEVNTGLTPPGNLLISAIDNIIAGLQDIKTYLAQR